MSIPGSASPLFFQTAAGAGTVTLEKSVRFNSGDSAYLNRTPSSAGSNTTWTLSTWVKKTGNDNHVFGAGAGNTPGRFGFGFNGSDKIFAFVIASGSTVFSITTDAVFRDPAGWYHIVLIADTGNSTQADRFKIYVNGVLQSVSGTLMPSSQNTFVNTTAAHTFGRRSYTAADYFNGYLASTILVDGTAKDETDFGAFDDNGVWQAAAYSGSFGTNGFHLFDFANESGIGNDSSGNDNDFTVNNLTNFSGTFGAYASAVTTPSGGWWSGDATRIFDGSVSTSVQAYSASSFDWDISSFSFTGTIEYYISGSNSTIQHDSTTVHTNTSGTAGWSSAISINSVSTVTFTRSSGPAVHAIRLNGTILIDSSFASGQDVLFDVPTNGDSSDDTGAGGEVSGCYATWNPLVVNTSNSSASLSNGNLDFDVLSSGYASTISTIAAGPSGKYYCEISFEGTKINSTNYAYIGVVPASSQQNFTSSDNGADMHRALNALSITASHSLTRSAIGTGTNNTNADWNTSTGYKESDVIGIAIDLDNNVLAFYKNGTTLGTYPHSLQSGEQYFVFAEDWANGNDITKYTLNAGQRSFAYSAPSGFKALCTTNLPTPTIADGSDYFAAKTFTGNGSTQSITGLEFSPDFLWIKNRADSSAGAHRLFDTIRGVNSTLYSNLDLGPTSPSNSLTSFDSNGFTVGSGNFVNGSSDAMIAWAWDAGTSTASNTDGDITSQVRASQTAGFSIVKYSGTGNSGDTVGHGLNAKPESIWIKGLKDGDDWQIYHSGLGGPQYQMFLNVDGSRETRSAVLDSTEPTSSVFTLGNYDDSNDSSTDYLALCFAPVEGYSAFGVYTGDGTAKKFVYLGFRPAFVLIKRTDGGAWVLIDSARSPSNEFTNWLRPNESEAESTNNNFDIVSNGFVLRKNDAFTNTSNKDHIYFAFAENPFQANGGLAR